MHENTQGALEIKKKIAKEGKFFLLPKEITKKDANTHT